VTGFLLPAQRRSDAGADRRFFCRRTGGPRIFAASFQWPPRKDMPLRQQVVLAVRRQPQRGKILRRGAQSRGDEDHTLGINLMQGAHHIVISAI